jgi:isopentenyldiphosphate isomerase
VEKGKSIIETAQCELAEELGITADAAELQHAFTIPAEQKPLGGCNAYEHVYFLHGNSETKMSLGTEEVSGVSWVPASKLLVALANGDDNYAPRTKQYCEAMGSFLEKMLNGSE